MIRTELQLRLPNSPGAAASACQQLADQHVNILAMALDVGGHLHLIVDNHVRAIGALREGHHRVTEHEVLYVGVENRPGGLARVLERLSEAGVNVDYAYCGAEPDAGVGVAIGVEDPQKAAAATGM
jgi:hypothetical protein